MGYRPHEAFAALAGERDEVWRTAAGLAVAFVAGLALYQLTLGVVAGLIGPARMQTVMDEVTFHGDTPRAVLITLYTFGFFAVGLAMALQALHDRGLASVIGPLPRAVADFLRVAGAVAGLYALLLVVLPGDPAPVRNAALPFGLWLLLLPLSLGAVLVQAGTEEMVFRGYLQQQLAARFRAWPVWVLVPAAVFALAHWSPAAAGPNASFYVVWAFAFGVLAADLTGRTGNLGAAVAFHAVNNLFAVLGLSLTGAGSGLALYHLPLPVDAPEIAALMPAELGTLLVAWLAARVALRV